MKDKEIKKFKKFLERKCFVCGFVNSFSSLDLLKNNFVCACCGNRVLNVKKKKKKTKVKYHNGLLECEKPRLRNLFFNKRGYGFFIFLLLLVLAIVILGKSFDVWVLEKVTGNTLIPKINLSNFTLEEFASQEIRAIDNLTKILNLTNSTNITR